MAFTNIVQSIAYIFSIKISYMKKQDKQYVTLEEIMDDLKSKLSVIVRKESCK